MAVPASPQPPHAAHPTHVPPSSAPPEPPGLLIVFVGLVTLVFGLSTTTWISLQLDGGSMELTLNEVARLLPSAERGTVLGGFAHVYLQYLSWPTALCAAFASVAATWPRPVRTPRRATVRFATGTALFGIVATAALAWSLNGLGVGEGYWTDCRVLAGPWVTGIGLALMLLGVRLGNRRHRPAPGAAPRGAGRLPGPAGDQSTRAPSRQTAETSGTPGR
ncbi:hypothetical protein SAMN06297387_12157 [Streptomyces zhaozhouensis]|uniref:Uncharacterized protein n=1 Tax=Streptomyces zhaozhouensis TaxID=1300267 RepID=A0A286E2W6_9ACTN|nr:hypothetical protein [Streptomyces zhaozhouensis]SOD65224.1 hypothetical protein SAMN06297387_12157 [Streptomyces zhaozhouensis]